MSGSKESVFKNYIEERYKGKVYKMERLSNPMLNVMVVRVEFHIPEDEADEIEMYKRINRVIEVIAEG
jgi:hypothetical protein